MNKIYDIHTPREGHRERFEAKLAKQAGGVRKPKQIKPLRRIILYVGTAAAACLALLLINKPDQTHEFSPEVAQAIDFYTMKLQQQAEPILSRLENISPEFSEDIYKEINQLTQVVPAEESFMELPEEMQIFHVMRIYNIYEESLEQIDEFVNDVATL